jgi:hypothetical protein
MWPAGSRRSASSELGIPPETFIYSDSGWDSSEPNILLDESRQDIPPRDILSDMESTNTDDRVRNTLPDVEPIDIDYLLEDNQRAINFLATGTQKDKQRFTDLLHARMDREWEARKAASQARRIPRRPNIYAYAENLGINSSLIRPHYELPIDTIASSRKKKSRQGITIRRNKRFMSTVESSSSHLNRTESSHSSNVRLAPNMIPCFPANNNTDVHHCDIVSNCSSTPHITEDSLFNTSQIRTRSTTKKLNHCLENQKGYY